MTAIGLNHRQETFCAEYLVDMNATQAAIRAGYSKRTAQPQSSRLLSNVMVRKRLLEALEERNERVRVDSDWVLKRLGELAEADIAQLFDKDNELRPLEDLPDAARRLIASVEFEPGHGRKVRKLKLLDRLKVLELIGKHVNVSAFRENVSHGVSDDLLELMEHARRRVANR